MSTPVVILLIVVVAAALFALAWWWSGRARTAEYNPLADGERGDAEVKTMKNYRPTPPTVGGGASG